MNLAERLALLEAAVKAIASGDYAQAVPFTQESDEVASLARSVEILKQSAEAMAEHRWISSSATLVGVLQGDVARGISVSVSLRTPCPFRRRRGRLYVFDENAAPPARASPRLVWPTGSAGCVRRGAGLVGQCANAACSFSATCRRITASSPAWAGPPNQSVAVPFSPRARCWRCSKLPRFASSAAQTKLFDEVIPVVALEPEVLQRNLAHPGPPRPDPGAGFSSRNSKRAEGASSCARSRAVLPQRAGTRADASSSPPMASSTWPTSKAKSCSAIPAPNLVGQSVRSSCRTRGTSTAASGARVVSRAPTTRTMGACASCTAAGSSSFPVDIALARCRATAADAGRRLRATSPTENRRRSS